MIAIERFHNANGEVSRYALACGHIEKVYYHNIRVTMHLEHGVYYVWVFDCARVGSSQVAWDSAESLTKARALFRKYRRKYKPA